MKKRVSFGDSRTARFLFKLIAPVMESPLRRRFFDPNRTLKGAGICSGQQVLEVGCGTGFFTIPAAALVGDEGCVYAVNRLVPEMHRVLRPGGAMAVWTTFPWWSPASLTRGRLFAYIGKKSGVHNFRKP
jgi:ubiquinone/menaquinone biosynthesis C-methylase UbiE